MRHVPARPKDPEIDESVLDIVADLAGQLIPPDFLPESELVMHELETGQRKPRVTDELLPAYAARLADVLRTYRDELSTPYCAVRMPESNVQRDRRLQVLTRLKELLPELAFLELHHAAATADKETTLITRLRIKSGITGTENTPG